MTNKKKYISNKKRLLFGKYKKRSVNSIPKSYLEWMSETLELSTWERSVIDSVLISKTERLIQKEVVDEMKWLK